MTVGTTNLEEIGGAFLDTLSTKRSELTKPKFTKKKKLEVIPGKSVSAAIVTDVMAPSEGGISGNSTHSTTNRSQKKRQMVSKLPTFFKKSKFTPGTGDSDEKDGLLQEADEFEQDMEADQNILEIATGQKTIAEALNLEEVKKEEGEFVVFEYEGEYFPGKILKFTDKTVEISALQKSLKSWKWPEKQDIHSYDWQDVVGHINEPKLISKQGFYSVPELERIWIS
ncbi:hypothetical protein LSTR_LSTR011638 [Laodelphax striatellus]|uniref:Uncharacterized protein n=1 Tax=Laodelphax striatellus TaxID=195883 RepID=A0A482X7L4_LAOST|nr:hypothetical protein LSTR_LSTR011638 [Laodelphax striatellus]